jgi:Immunoglobulin domain
MQFTRPGVHDYSGSYRCEKSGKEFHFNVTITSPPVIEGFDVTVDKLATHLENGGITVRVGQELIVRCLVKGNPPPKVYWRTNRRLLEGAETLHLSSVEKQNEGVYNCFAKFDGTGKDKKQIRLRVLS